MTNNYLAKAEREAIQQQKKIIRQQIRELRNRITGNEARNAGLALAKQLENSNHYNQAKNIACFLSFDGEINTQPVIEMILRDKGVCFLPKLKPGKPNRLWFMPYTHESKMEKNHLGIPEVDCPVNHAIAISKLDLILMPLVAFDQQGNRLGMGGGFYDATLAHLPRPNSATQNQSGPQCIGIAYQQQMVDQLPTQQWDFALDGVLTQENFFWF